MAKATTQTKTEEPELSVDGLMAELNDMTKKFEHEQKLRKAAETDLDIAKGDVESLSGQVREAQTVTQQENSEELDTMTLERDDLAQKLAQTTKDLQAKCAEVDLLMKDEARHHGFKMDGGPVVPMARQVDSLGKETPMSEGWKTFLVQETGEPVMYAYRGQITCASDSVWSYQSIAGRAKGMVEQAFLANKCGRRNPQTGSLEVTEWPGFSTERSVNVLVWIK